MHSLCNICIKPVNTGYKKVIDGVIVEMCCSKAHGPHLVTPSAAHIFYVNFWNHPKNKHCNI